MRVHSAEAGHGLASTDRPPLTPGAEHDLSFLIEREGRFGHSWERSLAVEQLRQRVFDVFSTERPDVLVFGEVPHAASSYLLYRWGKELGVPTVVIRWGPTPFHVNAVTDIDRRLLDEIGGAASDADEPSEASINYIAMLRRTYEEAMPAYSRDQNSLVSRVRSKISSGRIPTDPRLARAVIDREILRRKYESAAVLPSDGDGPIVSVFLHLQPERTTCPEGGRYVQQWLVVSELRRVFPPHWRILVREHPATFVRSARLVQFAEFYDAVRELENVHLASTRIPSFDLADSSDYVATVAGTVAFEAAARGRRSIVFGNAVYRGCDGIIDADRLDSIVDISSPDASVPSGLPIDRFLAAFDASPRTWTEPWSPGIDARGIQQSGEAVAALLPAAVAGALARPTRPPTVRRDSASPDDASSRPGRRCREWASLAVSGSRCGVGQIGWRRRDRSGRARRWLAEEIRGRRCRFRCGAGRPERMDGARQLPNRSG